MCITYLSRDLCRNLICKNLDYSLSGLIRYTKNYLTLKTLNSRRRRPTEGWMKAELHPEQHYIYKVQSEHVPDTACYQWELPAGARGPLTRLSDVLAL